MGDQTGQGGVIVEDEPCTKRVGLGGAVAAGEEREWHRGAARRLGIDLAVTDEQALSGGESGKSSQERSRVGLALGQGIAADDDGKKIAKTKVPQDSAGRTYGLVGADAKPMTGGRKVRKHGLDARIKFRQIKGFFVDVDEACDKLRMKSGILRQTLMRHQATDQDTDAIANETSHRCL